MNFNIYSLRLKLDDILISVDYEQKVIENLRYARKIVGKRFNVTFWNENIHSLQIKDFITRNDYILCDINTNITKSFTDSWFLITKGDDLSKWRYKFVGDDCLNGISNYINLSKTILKRERDENSNSW